MEIKDRNYSLDLLNFYHDICFYLNKNEEGIIALYNLKENPRDEITKDISEIKKFKEDLVTEVGFQNLKIKRTLEKVIVKLEDASLMLF